ncbi:hypothetical protein DIPPA_02063 [Diplonema papillatum]|nr:hypothetical protein DIPPA_02063 [Diplonema papillatum]
MSSQHAERLEAVTDPLVSQPAVQSPVPGVPNEESRGYRSDPEGDGPYDLQSFLETCTCNKVPALAVHSHAGALAGGES